MSRDHTKLRVFHDAHALALDIYYATRSFPKDEWFGLRSQIRRAAVSVPTNVVEGNARRPVAEYCSFLNVAIGSATEVRYLLQLATELTLLDAEAGSALQSRTGSVIRQLQRLLSRMELILSQDQRRTAGNRSRSANRRPTTDDR